STDFMSEGFPNRKRISPLSPRRQPHPAASQRYNRGYAPDRPPAFSAGFASLRPEAAVRRAGDDAGGADRRSPDFSGWARGRIHGPDHRHRKQQKAGADLYRPGGWRVAAADYDRGDAKRASAMVAGLQADRVRFRSRRIVAGVD